MHQRAIAGLLAARHGGPLFTPDYQLESLNDVWAIQSGAMATLGPVGGWKVGRWDADAPLIYAPIRAATIKSSPAILLSADSRLRGLELEVGFRIDATLPAPDDPGFLRKLAACVTPMPVFEVVDSRLADPRGTTPLWRLADFQINGGLIFGEPANPGWQPGDFDHPHVQLTANGTDEYNGPATLNTRAPFIMLADLVRECGDHCGGVQPGQIVTTGSFTGLRFFAKGTELTGRIAGLAPISATFEA